MAEQAEDGQDGAGGAVPPAFPVIESFPRAAHWNEWTYEPGWPITWEPPSQVAVFEWRGVVTLEALRTLTSYGRLTAGT